MKFLDFRVVISTLHVTSENIERLLNIVETVDDIILRSDMGKNLFTAFTSTEKHLAAHVMHMFSLQFVR